MPSGFGLTRLRAGSGRCVSERQSPPLSRPPASPSWRWQARPRPRLFPPASSTRSSPPGSNRPRRWRSRPDGRLFVTEQGGDLRVIKDGDAAPDAVRAPRRRLRRRARPARRRVRPELRDEPLRLRLLHRARRRAAQPRQPVHRQRRRAPRRRAARLVHPRPRQPEQRDQPQRRRDPLRPGRQALRRRRRQRERRPTRRRSTNLLGKILRINADGTIPTDNPFYDHGDRATNRAIWALGPAQPVHLRVPARHRPDVHQRRRPEHLGGDRRRHRRAPTTAGRTPKGRPTDPALPPPALLLRAHGTGDATAAPSPAARSTTRRPHSSRPTTSASTSSPTTAAAGSTCSNPRAPARDRSSPPGSLEPGRPRVGPTAACTTSSAGPEASGGSASSSPDDHGLHARRTARRDPREPSRHVPRRHDERR